jgi:beta-glucuronidase
VRRLVLLLLAAGLAATAAACPARAAEALPIQDGPDGRTLLDDGWEYSPSRSGPWTRVTVPHAWNAADDSPASMAGGVGYYRRTLRLPNRDRALRWIVRFESVNYRMEAWLNGRSIGRHAGAYLPFELPLDGVRRTGANRLLVRVDSRRRPTDLPPARVNSAGIVGGGWFNAGGLLREVFLRSVRGVDVRRVAVRPELRCASCDARVGVALRLRSVDGVQRRVRVTGTVGDERLPSVAVTVPGTGVEEVATRVTLREPRLWTPADPHLYRVRLEVHTGRTRLARWSLHTGVRSVEVRGGRLRFNGRPASIRGVGFHEDAPGRAMAIGSADRAWLVDQARAVGATMMRTHYPPSAELLELADREGMLIWSEIPVYGIDAGDLARRRVRDAALRQLETNIAEHGNHPSVLTWSIGNELDPEVGPSQGAYLAAATRLARELDPTRPVSLATLGYPSTPCQAEYADLDLIGINEYFGWYTGPGGEVFDRLALPAFLDARRACYPRQALMVTEFGAEANRDGPIEEKGTWAFQADFLDYHMRVYASKPWLSGVSYWALNEFRVRPGWEGGNPRPAPPVHQKGLITYVGRERKPAWEIARRWYTGEVPATPAPWPAPR